MLINLLLNFLYWKLVTSLQIRTPHLNGSGFHLLTWCLVEPRCSHSKCSHSHVPSGWLQLLSLAGAHFSWWQTLTGDLRKPWSLLSPWLWVLQAVFSQCAQRKSQTFETQSSGKRRGRVRWWWRLKGTGTFTVGLKHFPYKTSLLVWLMWCVSPAGPLDTKYLVIPEEGKGVVGPRGLTLLLELFSDLIFNDFLPCRHFPPISNKSREPPASEQRTW